MDHGVAARAAAAVAGGHLPGQPAGTSAVRLLQHRRLHGPGGADLHLGHLRLAAEYPQQPGRDRTHAADEPGRHAGLRRDRLSAGPVCCVAARTPEGRVGAAHHAAAVGQLPRAGLRLEADSGAGGRAELGAGKTAPELAARRRAAPAGAGWPQPVEQLPGHVSGVRLRLAAVHDPAPPGRPGARSRLAAPGERRPGGAALPDLLAGGVSARPAGRGGGQHLHLFAHARRLHHSGGGRRARVLYRADGLHPAGNRRKPAAGGGLQRGSYRIGDAVPGAGPAAGGL